MRLLSPFESGKKGFSLVEFIVAVAILGIAVIPLISAYLMTWKSNIEANKQSRAIMVARWKLERLRSTQGYSGIGTADRDRDSCTLPGHFDDEFDCRIDVTDQPASDGSYEFNRRRVGVTIFYNSRFGGLRTIQCPEAQECLDNNRPDLIGYFTQLDGGS